MNRENIVFRLPSLSLNLTTINMEPNVSYRDTHFHRAMEIIRVQNGEVVCSSGNSSRTITNKDILIVNSGVMHKLVSNTVSTVTYIQINIDKYINPFSKERSGFIDKFLNRSESDALCVFSSNSELSTIFDNIYKEFTEKKFCYDKFLRAHVYMLVAFLHRSLVLTDTKKAYDEKKITELEPIINYIDEKYSSKLSLDELASVAKNDKYHLCRLFKAATGSTIFEYINFVRLYNAQEMLLNTSKTISEIAFDTGFASIQYFNRAFKTYYGNSPSDYKKQFSEQLR